MTTILAIDTATDACSVALYCDGDISEQYEVIPRQHSQRLMPMLAEVLRDGDLLAQGVDAIAYGCGPGSFTGLRIAASAVQGLAFANNLPAIAVSTLACQVQTALRLGLIQAGDTVLSLLDARINEVYGAVFRTSQGKVETEEGPFVCKPGDIVLKNAYGELRGVGGGYNYLDDFPADLRRILQGSFADVFPAAQDLIPIALEKLMRCETQRPEQVLPVYVREEISWKKLAEQGKPK
jgi:tRNA threonylcarbamoyladenosine biosynthesis protein TsaB